MKRKPIISRSEAIIMNKLVHPSHKMTRWESSIVTLLETSRFGIIRRCKKCDGEQAMTAAGRGTHPELSHECAFSR